MSVAMRFTRLTLREQSIVIRVFVCVCVRVSVLPNFPRMLAETVPFSAESERVNLVSYKTRSVEEEESSIGKFK